MKKLMTLATVIVAAAANAALTVADVTARQRWPWNSLVDVDFTVNGDVGEAYAIDISATAAGGDKKLCATTFATEPIAASGKRSRVVWDLGADYPNFKADDLEVTVTATPFSDASSVYLVVDISGGKAASEWPVRYTTVAPVHTAGQNDPCKTTELWLKRVKAGTIQMGGADANYNVHTCTLTEDFYLGVFALTQEQCLNLWDNRLSKFTNELYRATRPADSINNTPLRQPYFSPANPDAAVTSGIVKELRDRTGLSFDLPTSWQWEYACRAGSTADRYEGCTTSDFRYNGNSKPNSSYEWYSEQGMWSEDYGTSYVDRYKPNPWGFYGMLGNVQEVCLDNFMPVDEGSELTDPKGSTQEGPSLRSKISKGGAWSDNADLCTASAYRKRDPWTGSNVDFIRGGRICLTVKKPTE